MDGDNANFGKALEDNDMVSVRTGASLVESLNSGKQVSVTSGWISGGNSATDGGAAINDGDSFFKRTSFTLYTDFKFNDEHDNTSVVLVGPICGCQLPHHPPQDRRHCCAQGQQRHRVRPLQRNLTAGGVERDCPLSTTRMTPRAPSLFT